MNISPRKCRYWNEAIEKEEKLRLKWFAENEEELIAAAQRARQPLFTEQDMKELNATRKKALAEAFKFPQHKFADPPTEPDDYALSHTMRPVPEELIDILQNSTLNGRIEYLNERYKVLPEERYYFPETTNFQYGWNMWNCAKTMPQSEFGQSQIIKQSFYRRRAGIERDPDWYTSPEKLSPTVCNNT